MIILASHLMGLTFSECRSKSDTPFLYPQVKGILYGLRDKNVDVAIASKSPTPDIAKSYLDKLSIRSMFVAQVCCFRILVVLGKDLVVDKS